jgi:cytochrome c biogenesis protein ResB
MSGEDKPKDDANKDAQAKSDAPKGNDAAGALVESAKKIVKNAQEFFAGGGAVKSFERIKNSALEEVKKTTPQEWIIAGLISLFLALIYNSITKSKDDSALNFATIFYAAILTFTAVVVRVKHLENQYAWSVVVLTVIGVLLGWRSAQLFLGAVPPLINYIRQELKKGV